MRLSKSTSVALLICGALLLTLTTAISAHIRSRHSPPPKLNISRDAKTGKVVLSWKGQGVLRKAAGRNRSFKKVYQGKGVYAVEATDAVALYRLESDNDSDGPGGFYSVNIVGYVNLRLPPGLSLIAIPLYQTNNTLATLWQGVWSPPPDGCQVFKYGADSTYEVSTYDALSGTWSNPGLDITIGTGFFFNNPSSMTVTQTFVGDVLQGWLINPLPAGASTKGSLVPQAGSINDVHLIPGDSGDEIRTYVNDGQGGGYYNSSVFDGTTQRWQPDLILNVAEGFWINKQQADDWVRSFTVQ